MSKEAMKLALEALEVGWDYRYTGKDAREIGERAMKSLREALAEQPEPLPVKTYSGGKAWHVAPEPEQQAAAVMPCGAVVSNVYEAYEAGKKAQPAPVQQCMEHGECFGGECIYPATQPAQQEPVAIHQFRKCGCSDWYDGVPDHHDGQGPYEVRTLYTTPQAQPAQSTADKSELETVPAKGGLLPAQQEPVGYEHHEYRPYGAPNEVRIHAVLASQYKLKDGTIAGDYKWLIDTYKSDKNTIKLVPLYTTPQAQPAPEPLTDEQKLMCWSRATHDADVEHKSEHRCLMDYATEIEAAHGITKGNT